jgi:UDP-N-acetylmuramyl pentapeptide phosphotransferase/UDP-N-acetylglucosamine-1-phosphate transferase
MTLLTVALLAGTFAAALATTALLMPLVMRMSERRGWVQQPGGRRLHARPTSNLGGVAIYGGFVAALLLTFAFDPLLQRSAFEQLRLLLLLLGGTLIFLVMWRDDVAELPPLPKLLAQFAAAIIAVGPYLWDHARYPAADGRLTEARGIVLTAFQFPFVDQISLWDVSPWLAIGATIFWIVWMTNTINWSDGIDGLAGGVSLIAALALAFNALGQSPPQLTIALLPLALAGACAGFLLFNFPPAKIFMGDSGAEFLGFALGVSAIIGGAKLATVLLVLGAPILDVVWLIISRALAGRSPAQGGRDHLHLRLRDLGFSARQVALFYYALSASFGLLGIVRVAPVVKLAALSLLGAIVIAVIAYATRRAALPARNP